MTVRMLKPDGTPRYVRCYRDDLCERHGGWDIYTVVFTGNYAGRARGQCEYVGLSGHGESQNGPVDRPRYSHLGKPISFEELPDGLKRTVWTDYEELWGTTSATRA